MQQARKKKYASHLSAVAPATSSPTLSDFSVVHRYGKLEIVKLPPVQETKHDYYKIPDTAGCMMPPIEIGCIKCRRFDFF